MIESVLVCASLSSNGIHVDERGGVTIPTQLGVDFRLCKIEVGNEFKLKYMETRWDYFNKHLFGGVMRKPNFVVSTKKKSLGLWRAGPREIEFGKLQFMMPHDRELLNTMVHEMCHQYVSEIIRPDRAEYGPTGHGPAWQQTMIAVGLPPDEKYTGGSKALWSTKKINEVEEKTERLVNNKKPDEQILRNEYSLMRYINPEAGVDCPFIVIPEHFNSSNTVYGHPIKKDGTVVKQTLARKEHLVVPGPLKIKTPWYRLATEVLDKMKQEDK